MNVGTTSYWLDSAQIQEFPTLQKNIEVDVIIIGAGITGITAAYLLKRSGKTVALIERDRCARIDTGHTTAHLTCMPDLMLQELTRTFGRQEARAVWDAGAAAIDHIVSNIRATDVDCDFRWVPGFLHAPLGKEPRAKDAEELQREAALAIDLGIRAEYRDAVPFFGLPGVQFPHQALFHPRKYLGDLVRRIPGGGSHVFENTAADEIHDDPLVVKAGNFEIRGQYLILATHSPLRGTNGALDTTLLQSKLAWYSTYVLGAKLPPGRIPEALYWDTNDPYYYLRVERKGDYDYAIFGGEDHKTGQEQDTREPFRRLEERFREFAPDAVITHWWSGQVIETNDGLPFIGPISKNQFVSTGYAGNGMTFGTLGAMMAADTIMQRKNPWQELFDVNRRKLFGGTFNYLAENKDYPFYMLRDRLAPTAGNSLDAVGLDEGKILNIDGRRVAAYRDSNGNITICSAVCTHLGCIVGWNDAEHSWDCPCHGSRFKPTGEVIAGPAEEALEKLPSPVSKARA